MAGFKRSRQQFVAGAVAAAIVTAALVLLLSRTAAFRWLESGSYDARVRWTAKPTEADKRIVILDIDNASLDTFTGNGVLGRWPWTRAIWREIVYYLAPGKPRVIAFDSIFAGDESEQVDKDFAADIKHAGNVVLAYSFNGSDEVTGEDVAARHQKFAELAQESTAARPSDVADRPDGKVITLNVPLEQLANSAAGLGNANVVIDDDGVIRSAALGWKLEGRVYPSLNARVAELVECAGKKPCPTQAFTATGHVAARSDWTIPLNHDGNLQLLWHGASPYERIPIWQVICSIYLDSCDRKEPYYKASYFKDKIVIIAATAAGSYEVRTTPFSQTSAGVEMHAAAIDNLLHHEAMRSAPAWFLPLAVVALAVFGAAILVWIGSASASVAAMLAVLAGYGGAAFWMFGHQHLWLPFVAPAISLVLSFASTGTIRYATTGRDLRKTRGTLNRYMAPQLVEYVLNNVDNLEFAGEKRELTIFFSDVRNFTTLTEKSDPMVLISMLNEYLAEMTATIFKHDGIVDKFIGDGILAYWGAFTPGNHAMQAAQASLEMFERLNDLNARWAEMGRPQIDIGVGLNTGEVILGNVGAGKKIEFTVIGDPVNLASRLESLNKEYKCHIIISEFTLAKLGEAAVVRSLGGVKVKGKSIETAIYELQGLRHENASAAKTK